MNQFRFFLLLVSSFFSLLMGAQTKLYAAINDKAGMNIIILGAPGAGKGTQAKLLAKSLHLPHIATGDMLRSEITKKSKLGLSAKKIMEQGGLLSDDIIFAMLQKRIKQADCQRGFILDGYPRTLAQAQLLQQAGIPVYRVIDIDVGEDEIVKRISGRRIHQPSGRVYHVLFNPPKVPGRDDITGEPLIQRADDKEETIKKRLSVYHQSTEPLINYYSLKHNEKNAPKFYRVSGVGSVEQIFSNIMDKVKS